MTDFIAALADLILPELMGGYAPEYVISLFDASIWYNFTTDNNKKSIYKLMLMDFLVLIIW